jgi:MFS family permease
MVTSGSLFLTRIWQGKIAFVAWLVPTIYVYLTRWLAGRDLLTGGLLLAAGVSSIGMTGSATFVAPIVFLAGIISLVASGDWRGSLVPALAGSIPLAVGLFVLSRFPLSETIGSQPLHPTSWFYREVFGVGVVCVIVGTAVWLAPWIVFEGAPRRLATGIAVLTAMLLVPGVIGLLSEISGLSQTLRRTLWLVPFPALVGLLASTRFSPKLGRSIPIAAVGGLVCLLIAVGHPLWRSPGGTPLWTFPPAWKINRERLATARSILSSYEGPGPILVRIGIMEAIAIQTVDPKAVNARTSYLLRTRLPHRELRERITLTRFIMRAQPSPPDRAVRQALSDLRVDLVCVDDGSPELIARLQVLGSYRRSFATPGFSCFGLASSSGS